MKIIEFLGRLAVCLLVLIVFEGLITLGLAFEIDKYTWIAWLSQVLLLIVCVWVACEWFYYDKLAEK